MLPFVAHGAAQQIGRAWFGSEPAALPCRPGFPTQPKGTGGEQRDSDDVAKGGRSLYQPIAAPGGSRKALQQGKHGIHKIAAKHSVGVGVVQRIKAGL